MDFEAVHARDVALRALRGDQGWVHLEDDVVERGAEVGAVDGGVPRGLWVVRIFAAGAVELDGFEVGDVREAHGQERVGVAHDARTFPELGLLILVELWGRVSLDFYLFIYETLVDKRSQLLDIPFLTNPAL